MSSDFEPEPSCSDARDPTALSVDQARLRILDAVQPVAFRQKVPLRDALGRILAEPIVSPVQVPSHTNSAMDGYALAGADLPQQGTRELTVIGQVLAGHVFDGQTQPGQCVRIMTGASMPVGADTVIMQEQARVVGDQIRIGDRHRPGQNVRHAGEDIDIGDRVLEPGRTLIPADLGLLASLGIGEVRVLRRPRVAFFSTGDELRSLGEPLRDGDVYDSNRYTLYGMLKRLGLEILDMGVVPDDPTPMEEALKQAAAAADVVITSGGVSVGEADFIKGLLETLGDMDFWKIAMKPGRPLTFGRLQNALFFGLPGNPVAVMVTFYQFVRPALLKLKGERHVLPLELNAVCTTGLRKRPGRAEFVRGVMAAADDGALEVTTTGKQGSGILRSMSMANCFIVLPPRSGDVQPGDLVRVQPFASMI